MMDSDKLWKTSLIVGALLVLSSLVVQFFIFRTAGIAAYLLWPFLIVFVVFVAILASLSLSDSSDD